MLRIEEVDVGCATHRGPQVVMGSHEMTTSSCAKHMHECLLRDVAQAADNCEQVAARESVRA